ncbi:hypothetical protein H0A66_03820 [Alcaligenaceae bacterium]|nr:hypothetical protein [Alcaligenaceae bacterium]
MHTNTPGLSTNQLAAQFMVKPESVRSAYCRDGHYQGLRPIRLPNGRLAWPAAEAAPTEGGIE